MDNKNVIQVSHLTKMYKLYDKPSDRLKEALGLTKKKLYREHYALHDVNFDIQEGECVGIIGTNGDSDRRRGKGKRPYLCTSGAGRRI